MTPGAGHRVEGQTTAERSPTAWPLRSSEHVYQAVHSAVIDHRLAPGTRLREQELAQTFAVSRTLVRQALHRLAQDGVIVLHPNRGARVSEPTRRDGEHVFDARRVVECEVARRLTGKLGAEQLATLHDMVEAEDAALRSKDKREAIRLSGQFHLRLAQMGGNPVFVRVLEDLLPSTSLLMALYKAPGEPMCVAHSHRRLLQVVAGSAPARAATEMRRHLNEIERSLAPGKPTRAALLSDVFGTDRRATARG